MSEGRNVAEIRDISGPTEASPGVAVEIQMAVFNCGDSCGCFELTASYLDDRAECKASVSPSRVHLEPTRQAVVAVSFIMPSADVELLAELWHVGTSKRICAYSCAIRITPTAMGSRKGLSPQTRELVDARFDFHEQQRIILRDFRLATSKRAEAEAAASRSREEAKNEADEDLGTTEKNASGDLTATRQKMTEVEQMLVSIGHQKLIDKAKSADPVTSSVVDTSEATQGLKTSRVQAGDIAYGIVGIATEVANWQSAQREQLRLNKALMVMILALPGFLLFVLGISQGLGGLIFLSLALPPVFMALGHGIWDLGKKEPGRGFNASYLLLWLIAPIAPFVALAQILRGYSASQASIEKRNSPMQHPRKAIPQIRARLPRLFQSVAQAEACYSIVVSEARVSHGQLVASIEAEYEHRTAAARSSYEISWEHLQDDVHTLHDRLGLTGAPYDSKLWDSWTVDSQGDFSEYVRLGQLIERGNWHEIDTPAIVPLFGMSNLLIKCSGSAKDHAVEAVRSVMLRQLAAVPAGKLRFTLIDPVGLGQSVASFMSLSDYDEVLVGGKVWTESRQIEDQLARLTEHMELVIQKFLRDRYATIDEYNAEAGEVAEPYRVLVVVNFPVNFTESAARRLVSICLNGPRCGVYTIVTADTEQQLPYGFQGGRKARQGNMCSHDESSSQVNGEDHRW